MITRNQQTSRNVMLALTFTAAWIAILPGAISAFVVTTPTHINRPSTSTSTTRRGMAFAPTAAPVQDEEEEAAAAESRRIPAWTSTANGGFLPNIQRRRGPPPVEEVVTIQEYKAAVVDEPSGLVVVRFYAPWCRACKATESAFYAMAREYSPDVKFVQVPLTNENAYLHQGLGVPTLPFAHIYHPAGGLVEERKLGKKKFKEFHKVLQSYVKEMCPVRYDESDNDVILKP